ncbi:HAMP domain-containing sensor histidine kinase [Nesterenkonia xinjiangensis]|uniref:histidine kinase n=1 Tax=Nesterenkonia xinjiangensis TaxID=225327 RepID=A0A7Z0GJ37_9MICC|nr:signal transduction histidine kinase [Nesterenkonia xinjiangensis]
MRRWAVRTRVLLFMVFLTVLTLVLAGAAAYLLQRVENYRTMDDALARTVTEFIQLGEDGNDPETGEPWSTADRLIQVGMQRTLLAEHESMLALRDGTVRWTPNEQQPVRLEEDPEFVDWVLDQEPITEHRIHTVQTAASTYRAVVVPVMMAEDDSPTLFVLAVDVESGMAALNRTFLTYTAVGLGAVAVTGFLGWLMVGRLLEPIRRLRQTVRSITETDISRRIDVHSRDDLGELTVTVNEMLDRLETAVTSQRRLLDDVGHELRTPITIVRGHLELVDPEDPSEVIATRDLAVDELDRMSRLVEDLVTLAKSDQIDFLTPAATDVDLLTDQVFEKAVQLGDRTWLRDVRAQAVLPLDAQRITQAWLQLAHNAVKFSAPGAEISLGSALRGDALHLWVRDAGAGISPEDQQTIFLRFARGTNSSRAEGSGLGLTIVDTIARLHGGQVHVESAAGQGSTFTIVLPLQELEALEQAGQTTAIIPGGER